MGGLCGRIALRGFRTALQKLVQQGQLALAVCNTPPSRSRRSAWDSFLGLVRLVLMRLCYPASVTPNPTPVPWYRSSLPLPLLLVFLAMLGLKAHPQ